MAYPRCGRIRMLYKGRRMLGVGAMMDRFRKEQKFTGLFAVLATLSVTLSRMFKTIHMPIVVETLGFVCAGCAMGLRGIISQGLHIFHAFFPTVKGVHLFI